MIHQNWILPSLKGSRKEIIKKRIKGRNIWGRIFFEFILQFALVITCLGRRFRINFPDAFLKISNFSKITRVIYPKNFPNQTCSHWLITPNQKALCIKTNIFSTTGNYRSSSRQLKNNFVNGAMLITINRVINNVILQKKKVLKSKETLTS